MSKNWDFAFYKIANTTNLTDPLGFNTPIVEVEFH